MLSLLLALLLSDPVQTSPPTRPAAPAVPTEGQRLCGVSPRLTGTHVRQQRCRTVREWRSDREGLDPSKAPTLRITPGQDAGKERKE